jgi:hypothetical protein
VDRLATTAFMTEMWRGLWVVFAWQFQPKVTLNYPFEKGPVRASTLFFCRLFCILFSYRSNSKKDFGAFSWRARVASLPDWRGALHCLQAV